MNFSMRYLPLLLIFILIGSCDSPVEIAPRPQSVSYQMDTLNLEKSFDDGSVYLEFQIENFKLDPQGDSVLAQMADSIQYQLLLNNLNSETSASSYQALFDSLALEYQRLQADGFDVFGPWSLTQSLKIANNQLGILSLLSTHSTFTGGAHPLTYQSSMCYRLADGALLNIDSLLLPGVKPDLRFLAESAFRQRYELGEHGSLNSQGFWFEDDQFSLPEIFSYDTLGLHFYYNPYDISPYAMGAFSVDLPYSIIAPYLKPQYYLKPTKVEAPES